ncbi:zona pellucida domain-containing protein [Anabas testudineus]|uniref:Zona pellucida sperm-binding protein 3 n=1 Tax=Anabas testudineus TaxID=64144 RepID=A0A7N6AUU5_ANATE|nr:zona pellucida domain-containing protein [Anabas testudineus]
MKIHQQTLYILWSVLSLGFLSCAADTHETFTRRKTGFKLSAPKSKLVKLSSRGHSSPSSTSPLSPLRSWGVHSFPPPPTPRSLRPGKAKANTRSHFAHLPDVSVTCSVSDFVVRVKPAFYGLGADAEELKLGSDCKSNGVLRPYGDLLFTYPLTACDAVRELPPGYLVYKLVLHYRPSHKRFPSRARRMDVDIECRFERNHHVYQLAVKPTWQTADLRKLLKGRPSEFQIDLMDDSWSEPAKSKVYHAGKMLNFQVSALHHHTGGQLYISSCYAAPSSGANPSVKYAIIDNLGCMVDSKSDPGSQFVSRTDNTLRFSLKAFQFTAYPDTEISVHCKLSITSEGPDPAHKSCTYRGNRWKALTGDNSICDCCDSQCVTSKPRRGAFEGTASSWSLLVSDQSHTDEDLGKSIEDETRINHHTDEMHSHESLWERTAVVKKDGEDEEEQGYVEEVFDEDEEGSITRGGMTEPDLDKLAFRNRLLGEGWEATGEEGPGNEAEDFVEREEQEERSEGREAEQVIHVNQKNSEAVDLWTQVEQQKAGIQRELWENSKYIVSGEEDERTVSEVEWMEDDDDDDHHDHHLADDGETTWYFTWR